MDTVSSVIEIDPQSVQEPEPAGYEFGYYVFDNLPNIEAHDIEATIESITDAETKDTTGNNFQGFPWTLTPYRSCNIMTPFARIYLVKLKKSNILEGQLYLGRGNILKRYMTDGNNTYKNHS